MLVALSVIGTTGLHLIEGWTWTESLWMVAITLTTIGFGEVHPLSEPGRLFMLGFMLVGVGIGGYALARLTGYVVDGGFAREMAARRQRKMLDSFKDHFIVVGFGRLGREVAQDLHHAGHSVVIIENDPKHGEEARKFGIVLHADGSSDAALIQARIQHARGIAVATPHSPTNVFVTLSARQLNPKLYIITRIDEADAESKALRAGADAVLSPFASSGSRMAHKLLHPHAADLLDRILTRDFEDLSVMDVPIGDAMAGSVHALRVRERFGIVVLAVRRPDGELQSVPLELRAGDLAVVAGDPHRIEQFRAAAAGEASSSAP
jgi:voltage-gated potassium channel